MTDEQTLARTNITEGARLTAETCTWLSEQHKHHGHLTSEACMWMALAGLAATVADLAEAANHPTLTERLTADCDGLESALLMLRAVQALYAGEPDRAESYAALSARAGRMG